MADTDKDGLLAQFQDVTGSDGERATFFLESSNWNLDVAVSSFFENDMGAAAGAPAAGDDVVPMEAEQAAETAAASRATEGEGPSQRPAPAAARGVGLNVAGIGGLAASGESKDSSDDSDDDEPGQAFYAGGSTSSGQQILGPPKKKGGADFVKDVFKKARESGAEQVEASSSRKPNQHQPAFTGTGFKLGSSESDPSQKVEGAKKAKPPREFVLKMWRQGFSIDDGDLRPYNDPANRAFLSSVMRGSIPDELVHMAQGGEVHVDMEDHKEEEFVKPKGVRKAFTGTGNVLGGIAPSVAESGGSSAAPPPTDPAASEAAAQSGLSVDASLPTTSVQIRLPDGKRLVAKLNQERHTVGDIRRFVGIARPDYAFGAGFSMHTTFPPKELSDDAATVQAAGLVGAALLLRQKK